jgi:hypothetical protein
MLANMQETETVFIIGPRSDSFEADYLFFLQAEKALLDQGYDVVNPAAVNYEGLKESHQRELWMNQLIGCDAVLVLPGWDTCRSATTQSIVADHLSYRLIIAFSK